MARRLALLTALAASVALPANALAAGITPSFAFGAAPAVKPKSAPRSYFSFTAASGAVVHDAITVTNASAKQQVLAVSASLGTTASSSGYAYVGAFKHCRATACWIHGLPSRVVLAPGKRATLPFTVVVPPGTPDRQYLAGISVQPANPPSPTKLSSHAGVGAQAVVITRVNVGVAITVGDLASLLRRLEIERVTVVLTSTSARILVSERDTGQTFVSAKGTAVCLDGTIHHTYPLVSRILLPGQGAVVPVSAPGLRPGSALRCRVQLTYGGSSRTLAWHGNVSVPSNRPRSAVQTGPHTFAEVPKAHVPRWAIALIAAGGLIVLTLLVVIVVLLRRRPRLT